MSQTKAVLSALSRLSLTAACAALLAGTAWAATPQKAATPAAAKAPAATAAPAPVPPTKNIWEETPYPLYSQGGRIDPFTRGKPKADPVDPTKRPTIEPLDKAMRAYEEAEALLSISKENHFEACRAACERGIQDLHQTILEISKNPAMAREMEQARELMERFKRLEATAKRLKQRQEIEAEFAKLKITVDGIVWTEQSPSAAISGKVCSEGSLLTVGSGGQDIQVHRIRRDSVVFLYRGVQIALRLDRGGR